MQAVGNTFIKLSSITLLALSVNLVGCQTFKNLTGGKDVDAVATAEKSEQGYYNDAIAQIDKGRYTQAIEDLNNLRTFYPTGQYAEQALLDVMYAQYESGKFEAAAASAEQFISLYPSNPQVSYAYYVRGVANMQGSSEGLKLFKLNQAERDTAYLRIAFANFQELINKYPNSPYAPDAAQRMTFIYNQFAESEMSAANWYVEREAYVAAVNRAKWVFQYYPLSESVPDALAVLAYSHEKLGLNDLANEYKTLLQINYPNMLSADGRVKLNTKRERTLFNKLTFGQLNRFNKDTSVASGNYNGATKTQVIRNANQLRLPSDNAAAANANAPLNMSPKRANSGINVGLGLPEASTERVTSQSSTGDTAREADVDPQNMNPVRRTTLPAE
ncbi:outer membrane protein assembly factor BamD [Psychrobacter faecalis]|jgi:outer membrane protein assembly factor BamD|uniref:Outer membrane protein assembly factor BamD n=1 Tax=Psychrobacter faecalis TaxID=180588 RepID=A0ABT9HF17_9GAMM|nr:MULTISPECIES: outer membrane protein assembly factor BamD [Psychrobacter]MDN5694968.1 outer membrane protein assembly factor BamD [Psychrobacter sp.]MDP4544355.1 outer membrane protein assembly factor BamD [Psychrobacter faecalis]WLW65373.1 outer membrane protein assembly factor BamD [Psychrobacter sp. van23A]